MIQRKPKRFKAVFNAGYGTSNASMLLPCRIVDISWGGSRIELYAKHAITIGSTIELHIEIQGLQRRIIAAFRCLWAHPVNSAEAEHGNLIGGCFTDMSPEDRTLLLDHAQKQTITNPTGKQKPCKQYTTTSLQYS